MIGRGRGDHLSIRYVHDDRDQRRVYGLKLAKFVRAHRARWNITTFVEALDLLGRDVATIRLTLRRRRSDRLAVTIYYELAPIRGDHTGVL